MTYSEIVSPSARQQDQLCSTIAVPEVTEWLASGGSDSPDSPKDVKLKKQKFFVPQKRKQAANHKARNNFSRKATEGKAQSIDRSKYLVQGYSPDWRNLPLSF